MFFMLISPLAYSGDPDRDELISLPADRASAINRADEPDRSTRVGTLVLLLRAVLLPPVLRPAARSPGRC